MLKVANGRAAGRLRPFLARFVPAVAVAAGAATGLVPGGVPLAQAQSGPQSITYNCTRDPEGLSLPTDARDVMVEAQGAAGSDASGTGGRGMVLRGIIAGPAAAGQFLTIKVGCRDGWGYVGGGAGGRNSYTQNGTNGGGASGVIIGGDPIVVCGGGGGGGASYFASFISNRASVLPGDRTDRHVTRVVYHECRRARCRGGPGFSSDGIAGYVSTSSQKGMVPLYRLYSPGLGKHLFTTSTAERASGASGYAFEAITAYVARTTR